jgi:hypothetical protein
MDRGIGGRDYVCVCVEVGMWEGWCVKEGRKFPVESTLMFFCLTATTHWPYYWPNCIIVDYMSHLFYKQRVSELYLCVSNKSRHTVFD